MKYIFCNTYLHDPKVLILLKIKTEIQILEPFFCKIDKTMVKNRFYFLEQPKNVLLPSHRNTAFYASETAVLSSTFGQRSYHLLLDHT